MPAQAGGDAVSFSTLLEEMVDRTALARFPQPAYDCTQFSSYDRASTSPKQPETWFANADHGQFLRVEERHGRREFVMMDAPGPGAVVRFWSANPKGTLRVYLDGAETPVIEAAMADVLGGRWLVGEPLAAVRARGWNLYLPIPYAERCVITSDSGEFYYQINARTYAPGAAVRSFQLQDLTEHKLLLDRTQHALLRAAAAASPAVAPPMHHTGRLPAGATTSFELETSSGSALKRLGLRLNATDHAQARRSTVLRLEFDGEQTVWCPAGAFFAADVGVEQHADWWRSVKPDGSMECRWVMPFRRICRIALENLGEQDVQFDLSAEQMAWSWDERSMHFHTVWRQEHPIPARGAAGTRDFNYVAVEGRGVYAGDTLAVVNPVPQWWGEGDEKIYVDGEGFPSHFGTGTEDYYGYAWCCPTPFTAPFHGQPRCDGGALENNWGHTTVTRVRSLDAIPFRESLRVDMEVWHWKECEVGYAVSASFYALPGARVGVEPMPLEAARPIPQPTPLPPPFRVAGAVECEAMEGVILSPGVVASPQGGFGPNLWSGDQQLFVRGRGPGDFVELPLAAPGDGACAVVVHATRSWDYAIVRFSVNGARAGDDVDLFNQDARAVEATGPIRLGVFQPQGGRFMVRVEIVGGHPRSEGTRSYFGLDCVVLEPQ
jgi:hypothetical protein